MPYYVVMNSQWFKHEKENDKPLLGGLQDVRGLVSDSIRRTSLGSMVDELETILTGGKMLRARMGLRIGTATGVPYRRLIHSMSAVEMIHTASLLHDDVIDAALLRRGAPSFWASKGVSGAILLGDLLVCQAITLLNEVDDGLLAPEFVKMTGEMCDAEAEQELLLPRKTPDWETCVNIARRKTGALFAFVGYSCGLFDNELRIVLREAGYALGTAYQLADDLLDAFGNSGSVGKTLGNDAACAKVTAVSACCNASIDPVEHINALCESCQVALSPWPSVQEALNVFMTEDLCPEIDKFVECFSVDAVL